MHKRRWLKILIGAVLVLMLGVGVFVFTTYNNAKATVNDKIHRKVTAIDEKATKEKLEKQESLNILLLGIDERDGEGGRSDSLIVMTLDPSGDRMQMVSIPRDTRTMIVGKGFEDKINHAYAFGGTDMAIDTVENLLDVELDYYVELNMEGMVDLIDTIGGITVENELDWVDVGHYEKGFHYAAGTLQLDGAQTMGYVRMRYDDPRGDFGRTDRQRKVIGGIIDKGASVGSVSKINSIIDVLGDNVATNMDFDDMKNLLLNYNNVRKNSESYMLQGSGTTIDDIYYYIVPEEEIGKVSKMIADLES